MAIMACPRQCFSAPAAGAPAKRAGEKAELNQKLDKLLRSELLMTVGGGKPISSTFAAPEVYELIAKAVGGGQIANPDIIFFPAGGEVALASRSAIARLIKDKTAAAVFKKYGLPFPRSAQGWISAFIASVSAETARDAAPLKVHLIRGVAYGYPPLEAEAYALDYGPLRGQITADLSDDARLLQSLEQKNAPVPDSEEKWLLLKRKAGIEPEIIGKALSWQQAVWNISLKHKVSKRQLVGAEPENFILSGYLRFTDREVERDGYYTRVQFRLAENYEQLIRDGHTPLEIINNPQWLKKNLPAFPENLLEN